MLRAAIAVACLHGGYGRSGTRGLERYEPIALKLVIKSVCAGAQINHLARWARLYPLYGQAVFFIVLSWCRHFGFVLFYGLCPDFWGRYKWFSSINIGRLPHLGEASLPFSLGDKSSGRVAGYGCHENLSCASVDIDEAFAGCRGADEAFAGTLNGELQAAAPGNDEVAVDL